MGWLPQWYWATNSFYVMNKDLIGIVLSFDISFIGYWFVFVDHLSDFEFPFEAKAIWHKDVK